MELLSERPLEVEVSVPPTGTAWWQHNKPFPCRAYAFPYQATMCLHSTVDPPPLAQNELLVDDTEVIEQTVRSAPPERVRLVIGMLRASSLNLLANRLDTVSKANTSTLDCGLKQQ